jgi:hypothetical protein
MVQLEAALAAVYGLKLPKYAAVAKFTQMVAGAIANLDLVGVVRPLIQLVEPAAAVVDVYS